MKSVFLKKVISSVLALSAVCIFSATLCFAYEPSDPNEKTPETPYEGTFDIDPHYERAHHVFDDEGSDHGDVMEEPLRGLEDM